MTTGQRLARVQYDSHLAIDGVYGPLADAVEQAVLHRASPDERGMPRLSDIGRVLALVEIGRLLDLARPALAAVVMEAVRSAATAAYDVGTPPAAVDIVPVTFQAEVPVAASLRNSRSGVLRQTGALLVRGGVLGLAAREVAKTVRDYFSPWFATRRDAQGALTRAQREGAIRSWPGRAGMASERARTVMLTETTAAHARATHRLAEREEMGLQWHLSAGHSDADECDEKQHRSSRGQDRGVYVPSEFPKMPSHPNCRCYSSVVPLREVVAGEGAA